MYRRGGSRPPIVTPLRKLRKRSPNLLSLTKVKYRTERNAEFKFDRARHTQN